MQTRGSDTAHNDVIIDLFDGAGHVSSPEETLQIAFEDDRG